MDIQNPTGWNMVDIRNLPLPPSLKEKKLIPNFISIPVNTDKLLAVQSEPTLGSFRKEFSITLTSREKTNCQPVSKRLPQAAGVGIPCQSLERLNSFCQPKSSWLLVIWVWELPINDFSKVYISY
jgi:hypothetical protein